MDTEIYNNTGDDEEESSEDEEHLFKAKLRKRDLTNKYLSGELSFTEYSKQWLGKDLEEVAPTSASPERFESSDNDTKQERKKSQLTPALLGLMGEANLRFVRGDREMAEKICQEIICEMPTASEPYELLSQIFEHDSDKSLQFLLLAAHLKPSRDDLWLHLATLSKKREDVKQELHCYSRAINAKRNILDYHLKRIEALKEYEQTGFPVHSLKLPLSKCYMQLITHASPVDPVLVLKFAKEAASMFYTNKDYESALEAMNIAYAKCYDLFSNEDVNLYLDLLILQKKFSVCLDVLVAKCNVEIEAEVQTISEDGNIKEHTDVVGCVIPESLPVDISTKLLICVIYLGSMSIAEILLNKLLMNDVEIAGDLYLDVEEALISQKQYEMALRTLNPLVESQRYRLPAVWLKYAECLTELGRVEEAIESFQTVVRLAPQHLGARMKLYEFYISNGNTQDALKSLEQNEKTTLLDTGLLYERCNVLKSLELYSEYMKVGQLLLYRHFTKLRNKSEIQPLRVRTDCLHTLRTVRGEDPEDKNAPAFDNDANKLTMQEEWDLFTDLYMTAKKCKKYAYMVRLSFEALGSKLFSKNKAEIEFMALIACIHHREYYYAYNLVREMFWQKNNRDKERFYNLLNLVIRGCEDTRYQKLILRLYNRIDNSMLALLRCNNFLCSGLYREALPHLVNEYKKNKSPEACYMLGLTMLFRACQTFIHKNFNFILQSMSLLFHYAELRGPDAHQEVNYNIGRAYHMLGMFNLAIFHYTKALEAGPFVCSDHPNALSLTYQTAYNLHCIYKTSSPKLAEMYLEKYIVI